MRLLLTLLLAFMLVTPVEAASLVGSSSALQAQNKRANHQDYSRLTERDLAYFKKHKLLVRLPSNEYVKIDRRLPRKYRWCRPETRAYILSLGKQYHAQFGKPIRINSAVRTVERQAELKRTNGNAARATSGLKRSSHLTGATIDIAKIGMSTRELRWMRGKLLEHEAARRIEATEEMRQSVFHVMVYRR